MEVDGSSTVATLNGLTIENGNPGIAYGGGVLNYGTVNFNYAVVEYNAAASETFNGVHGGGAGLENFGTANLFGTLVQFNTVYSHDAYTAEGGGGIYNSGTLNVSYGLIANNTATNSPWASIDSSPSGGGVFNSRTATITYTAISGNTASQTSKSGKSHNYGGGVYNGNWSTLLDDTLTANTAGGAAGHGGGLALGGGVATLISDMIAFNSATVGGGGISDFQRASAVYISNTIVAQNVANNGLTLLEDIEDQKSAFDSFGSNLIGVNPFLTFWQSTDELGTASTPLNARLHALAFNGGQTKTLAIDYTSPAVNKGGNYIAGVYGLTTDQRGDPRISDGICDIGAYEYQYVIEL